MHVGQVLILFQVVLIFSNSDEAVQFEFSLWPWNIKTANTALNYGIIIGTTLRNSKVLYALYFVKDYFLVAVISCKKCERIIKD